MRKAPLVPVAIATIGGIIIARYCNISTDAWLIAMAVSAIIIGIILLLGQIHNKQVAVWTTAIFFLSFSGLLYHGNDSSSVTNWTQNCPKSALLRVELVETPIPSEKSIKIQAEVYEVNSHPTKGTMSLYLKSDSIGHTLKYGNKLLIHGYPDTLNKILYATSDHYLITSRGSKSFRAISEDIRMHLLERMQNGPLNIEQAGIAEALTLGWRARIDKDTRDDFQNAGIAHILAVSGLHVGLLTIIIGWLLIWLGKERKGRIIRGSIQILVVWIFCFLTGFAPSTIRASLMFSLFIIANILGRRTSSVNILATTAIITLLSNPTLLFNVGWQLSYSAVLGILLAQPVIQSFQGRLAKFSQAAALSIITTLATMPTMLAYFHRFAPYFLIANVIIIPLAFIVLSCSLLYMIIPCGITAFLAEYTIKPMQWLTNMVASLPGSIIDNLRLTPIGLITLSVIILLLYLAIKPTYHYFRNNQK